MLTHYLHGKCILNSTETLKIFSEDETSAFYLGTQGPDFFFTHRYLPWMKGESVKEIGHKIHKLDPKELIMLMQELAFESKSKYLCAYYLGFLCHYSLDSTCHPYINFMADKLSDDIQNSGVRHAEIESALDFLLTKKYEDDITLNKIVVYNEVLFKELSVMYVNIIENLLSIKLNENTIFECLEDYEEVLGWLNDTTGIKMFLVSLFERNKPHNISSHIIPKGKLKEDYANENQENWLKNDEVYNNSFYDLFDQSIKKANKLIVGFNESKFIEITNNDSF